MRNQFGLALLLGFALLTAGCAGGVRPSADQLSDKLRQAPTSIDREVLINRGFVEVDGSQGPILAVGHCYEKARAHPLYGGMAGVDVVRVCLGDEPTQVFVFMMHTHGEKWTEVYPNDRTATKPADFFDFNVSAATRKRLKQ